MRRVILPLLILVTLLPAFPAAAQDDRRCFPETGFCIHGRIRTFWEQNGGLPVFGYPVGSQQEAMVEGRPFQTQWFERTRLELHPENAPPYDVLLGRIGADRLAQQGRPDWQHFPQDAQRGDCLRFETGHAVCGAILGAWQAHGLEFDGRPGPSYAESLALFGVPLSSPTLEVLEGQVYTVQWFERARFELHPEHAPPYHVLLGLLGNEIRANAPTAPQSAGSEVDQMTSVGNAVFFSAHDTPHGRELWITDGTPAGTRLVKDLIPGPDGGSPHWMVDLNGLLLFSAQTSAFERDALWRSDGTTEGTYPLLPVNQVADPVQLTVVGNRVFFVADDGIHGQELWMSDGTSTGTRMVTEIYPGEQGIYPEQNMPMGFFPFGLTRVGNRLFFHAEAPGHGYSLWVSDGTAAGTRFVSRLTTATTSPEYWDLTALNETTLLFIARTGRLNYGLYRSDGTAEGTYLIRDLSYTTDSGAMRLYPPVSGLRAIGGRVYFIEGLALKQSDGTAAGTIQISQFLPGPVAAIDGRAYLLSLSRPYGFDLVPISRMLEETVVSTIAPTLYQANAMPVSAAGRLFIAVNGTQGRAELWVSNGTEAGTQPVLALQGRLFGQTDGLQAERPAATLGTRLIFAADDGVNGGEVWISDGTPRGTMMLKDIQ
ncbi:ELWxxDGT repeat protein [Candidatus Oscillochloris fontis]|uniref:ELWxxDGT repeat protein n=1 Tax=Candidatus Oscillochloris fontis TaxID=2496868 RepID=UPI00101C8B8A|nr:ELWxxDGT repeat protein [Candidatus Oscillochloris fontis]